MTILINWKELKKGPYKKLAEVSRQASAEGCVLLKNDDNILPLTKNDKISLFGRTQIDYNKSGTGSGGLVRTEYVVNILDGILANRDININTELVDVYKNWIAENPFDTGNGWASEPWCQMEMVPDEKIVERARRVSDIAVIVLGRTAGEDKDNSADKGSWYLSDEESEMLDVVSKYFEKTVVLLNVGNIIDMSWVEKYNIKSVMYVWQGGQEGGNAVADVLSGKVTPSGKLTDTIARHIDLYPSTKNFGGKDFNLYQEDIYVGYRYFETFARDEVLYPFGFGMSYTTFEQDIIAAYDDDTKITLDVKIKNTGEYAGKEVVQVYFSAPVGVLGKAERELCAFAKTKLLLPGESEILHIEILIDSMSAYDDSGITGNKSCYVMEAGKYNIYCGNCVRTAELIYSYTLNEIKVTKKCCEALAPEKEFDIIFPVVDDGKKVIGYRRASTKTVDLNERIKRKKPEEIAFTGDKGIKLIDVKNNKKTIHEFVAQLTDMDLRCLLLGEGLCSPKVRPGTTGTIGGTTESLAKFGIPLIAVCDGPSGIRMDNGEKATSIPNGTAIASTWNVEIAEELYENISVELCINNIDAILGPGVNIHRSPLNGRNFEYLSEDPFLTGKIAAAFSRGIRLYGNSATIKHFMANSQEYRRNTVDSVMSERAAREIYLKGFEIAVKEGDVKMIMTSYNPVNGIWTANNYDLNTVMLRDEWGFDGLVMSDWWPKLAKEESDVKNLQKLVAAQNDVYMLTNDVLTFKDNIISSVENGTLERGQLQRNAINILKCVMASHSFERFVENGGKLQKSLSENINELDLIFEDNDVCANKKIEFKSEAVGRGLIEIEYSSLKNELAQMTLGVMINGKSAGCVTVNGTLGEVRKIYIDVSTISCDISVEIMFSDEHFKIHRMKYFV